MKCVHCGANIPDDQMICPVCGAEVQIVPDYNPLDDVLAREVRGSVEGATRQIRTDDIRRYRKRRSDKKILILPVFLKRGRDGAYSLKPEKKYK